ncbi:MAG: hypothetical protein EHM23_08645 [Acidobacteria bacterium]|nr:MAG: hypothetical protein EHM23_08645 [Acidobacteriota bacterium]
MVNVLLPCMLRSLLAFALFAALAGTSQVAARSGECEAIPLIARAGVEASPSASALRVVSLNLAKETRATAIQEELSRFESLRAADILLLQEVQAPAGDRPGGVEELAERMGLHFLYCPAHLWKDGSREGLAILSRYPLENVSVIRLPAFDLVLKNRCRIALSAVAVTPIGRVRLVNLHLDSRVTLAERLEQLQPVLSMAGDLFEPVLVGGDFNTSDLYWLGRVLPVPGPDQEARVRAVLEAAGFRTPFVQNEPTFDLMGLRLDSIYVRGMIWTDSGMQSISFSDHRALWVSLEPVP